MTYIVPIIVSSLLIILCVVYDYRVRNFKSMVKNSDQPAQQVHDEQPCNQYALYVHLYDKRYDIYRWEDIEHIYLDEGEGLLSIRLHSGEEHNYTDWCSYGITPVSDVIAELNEDLDKD